MNYHAIILAAGKGHRYSKTIPKQYTVFNNELIINYSLKIFCKINSIKKIILVINKADFNKFKSKIYEVGYFEQQRSLYDGKGYFIRQDVFYKVENDFPRIQENEIRVGVGDVKYSIILSQCLGFVKNENAVFNTLKS